MEQLSSRCYDVLNFHYGNLGSLYTPEVFKTENQRIFEEHNLLNNYLLAHIEEEKFQKEIESFYSIQLYCVVYLEKELPKETFLGLINRLLSLPIPDHYHFLSPMMLILMSSSDLTEEIIEKIYFKIMNEVLLAESYSAHLGNMPYDYRYHILKREETSENLVSKILNSYNEVSLDELKDYFQIFVCDMNSELESQNIKNIEDIKGKKELERDYHYFQMIEKYIKDRNNIQKTV